MIQVYLHKMGWQILHHNKYHSLFLFIESIWYCFMIILWQHAVRIAKWKNKLETENHTLGTNDTYNVAISNIQEVWVVIQVLFIDNYLNTMIEDNLRYLFLVQTDHMNLAKFTDEEEDGLPKKQ